MDTFLEILRYVSGPVLILVLVIYHIQRRRRRRQAGKPMEE